MTDMQDRKRLFSFHISLINRRIFGCFRELIRKRKLYPKTEIRSRYTHKMHKDAVLT
jgi:hypothetical protein